MTRLTRWSWARAAVIGAALALFALAAWRANRAVCPDCVVEDVWLSPGEGAPLRGRLYLPRAAPAPLPAVIVLHGYLANLAFVEVPWAADLASLGCAVLLVDRRGHGRSAGSWRPNGAEPDRTAVGPDTDVAAALHYLRSHPSIDAARLAVLGHSDGGTAAIIAGSTDWALLATVALSASVAPANLVNHVAPRNLLLAYGTADDFVLDRTDAMLIAAATRGYLDGPGRVGSLADGSARSLLAVRDRGHVDVLYNEPTRREVLEWLRAALRAGGPVTLSTTRHGWIATGALAIGVLLAASGRAATPSVGRRWYAIAPRLMLLATLWSAALLLAGWIRLRVDSTPGQEGATVLALLGSTAALVGGAAFLWALAHRVRAHRGSDERSMRGRRARVALKTVLVEATRGALLACVVVTALLTLLRHLYDAPLAAGRWGLFAVFVPVALLSFVAIEAGLTWIGGGRAVAFATLVTLAAVTALLAPWLFARMSVLPVYLFAFTLLLAACQRFAEPRTPAIAGPVMATLVFARLAAGVNALY